MFKCCLQAISSVVVVPAGPSVVQGHTRNLLINSHNDNMLLKADGEQTVIGPDKLRITGKLMSASGSSLLSPSRVWRRCGRSHTWKRRRRLQPDWSGFTHDGAEDGDELIHQPGPAHTPSRCSPPSGPEGALFQHSVEVPLLRSELFKDLR